MIVVRPREAEKVTVIYPSGEARQRLGPPKLQAEVYRCLRSQGLDVYGTVTATGRLGRVWFDLAMFSPGYRLIALVEVLGAGRLLKDSRRARIAAFGVPVFVVESPDDLGLLSSALDELLFLDAF